ncbi:hypothetical protein KY345_02255 [Candidatus Woesearchaeota archaeon]|nr:hypothetical protein [Candidatus Woesearchaeota archaeon]
MLLTAETTLADKLRKKRFKSKGQYNDSQFMAWMYPVDLTEAVERAVREVNPEIELYADEGPFEEKRFELGFKRGVVKVPLLSLHRITEKEGNCSIRYNDDEGLTRYVREAVKELNAGRGISPEKGFNFRLVEYDCHKWSTENID